jgi:hypothetical protein
MKLLLAMLLATGALSSTALAPSGVLATPTKYDRQTVTVLGVVRDIVVRQVAGGFVSQYALCDSMCVNVVEFDKAMFVAGQSQTVTGTFHKIFSNGIVQARNVIVVGTTQ